MGENQFKTFGFLLKFVLLFQLMYVIYNHQFGAEATQPGVYDRLSKIEAQNQRHEKEISLLKTEKIEDRKEIHQLRERVALLEDSTFSNVTPGDKISRTRSERPARLLPLQLLFNTKKNESEEDSMPKRFYGPPTNCSELQKLGYTLNGYYLVKGKEKLDANRIQVVYCQFLQPPWEKKQRNENWIGNVHVMTKTVHFYVTRKARLGSGYGVVTFDVEQLNVGGAMNLKTGEFTVPVDGIYHFEFRCLKDNVPQEIAIYLVVKQKTWTVFPHMVFFERDFPVVAATFMSNLSYSSTGSLTASLKLKTSDIVKIYSIDSRDVLYDSHAHYTQFVGWLVEEDLAVV